MNTSDLASKVLIVGVPVAVAMCGWGLTEIISNGKRLERALTSNTVPNPSNHTGAHNQ